MLTIEEMYAFKAKYEAEIAELERKKAVVDEFIAFAEAKELAKSEETETETETEVEVKVEEPVAEYNY